MQLHWEVITGAFGLLVLAVAAITVMVWFFSSGLRQRIPARVKIEHLAERVPISWNEYGAAIIEASSEEAFLTALGYSHGIQQAWTIALWRQTATGRLSTWFGANLLMLDSFTRQLGFAANSQETFNQLPPNEQAWLRAYSNGINAAFTERNLLSHDEFALLDVNPEPWEPWHSLAIERLIAWSTTAVQQPTSTNQTPDFFDLDQFLRDWLQLGFFEYSTAWVMDFQGRPTLWQRHVSGSSTYPFFAEIIWVRGADDVVKLASIPGAIMFPAGSSPSQAWTALLRSPYAFNQRTSTLTPPSPASYERILNRDGTEFLVPTPQRDQAFTVNNHNEEGRLIQQWELSWPGFSSHSDVGAWMNLIDGAPAGLSLFESRGIRISVDERILRLSEDSLSIHYVLAHSDWENQIQSYLDSLVSLPNIPPEDLFDDCYSPWAAQISTQYISQVSPHADTSEVLQEALTYLRNWDHQFSGASIAAAIFDTWTYHLRNYSTPDPSADQLVQTLGTATMELAERFGSDMSQWRLEDARPIIRNFPAWTVDSLFSTRTAILSNNRFARQRFAGQGHPSALCWGSYRTDAGRPASSYWEGWMQPGNDPPFIYRRQPSPTGAFLERYLITLNPVVMHQLERNVEPTNKTRLLPASR